MNEQILNKLSETDCVLRHIIHVVNKNADASQNIDDRVSKLTKKVNMTSRKNKLLTVAVVLLILDNVTTRAGFGLHHKQIKELQERVEELENTKGE